MYSVINSVYSKLFKESQTTAPGDEITNILDSIRALTPPVISGGSAQPADLTKKPLIIAHAVQYLDQIVKGTSGAISVEDQTMSLLDIDVARQEIVFNSQLKEQFLAFATDFIKAHHKQASFTMYTPLPTLYNYDNRGVVRTYGVLHLTRESPDKVRVNFYKIYQYVPGASGSAVHDTKYVETNPIGEEDFEKIKRDGVSGHPTFIPSTAGDFFSSSQYVGMSVECESPELRDYFTYTCSGSVSAIQNLDISSTVVIKPQNICQTSSRSDPRMIIRSANDLVAASNGGSLGDAIDAIIGLKPSQQLTNLFGHLIVLLESRLNLAKTNAV